MQLKVRQIGAPTIAVTNARQIKTDSLWAIGLAVVLIVAFLAVVLPNVRNICLVLLTVGLGWLLGLAVLSTVRTSVSVIVLGISSVAVGIAINYPLHFVAHLRHAGDVRRNLRELASPLLIGNVTTPSQLWCRCTLRPCATWGSLPRRCWWERWRWCWCCCRTG